MKGGSTIVEAHVANNLRITFKVIAAEIHFSVLIFTSDARDQAFKLKISTVSL